MRRLYALLAFLFLSFTLHAQLDVTRVMNIGRNALYFSDYMVAIDYFNRVLEVRPWMAEPYLLRGYAKMMLEDYDGARRDASQALSRNAFLQQAYLIRAVANQSLRQYAPAEKDYRTALGLSPDDVGIRFNLAGTLFELKKYPQADSIAKTITPKSKFYPQSLLLRANIALNQGDTIKAEKWIGHSLAVDSTQAMAYAFKADIYRMQHNIEKAMTAYDRAIELAPNEVSLYINRGLARYQKNNYKGALEDYNQALSIDPGNMVAHFNRALLRFFVADLNNALADFKAVLDKEPDQMLALFNSGLIYTQIGQPKKAISAFDKVLAEYPHFLNGYLARSEARLKAGDRVGAEKDRFKAFQLQKDGAWHKAPSKKKKKNNDELSEEEQTIEDYQQLMADNERSYTSEKNTLPASLRGKVQELHAEAHPMGYYKLTLFLPEKLLASLPFVQEVSAYNEKMHIEGERLAATVAQTPLDSIQTRQTQAILTHLNENIEQIDVYFFRRGLYKYALIDFEGAALDFKEALSLNPRFTLAYFALATAQLRLIDLIESEQSAPSDNITAEYRVMGSASPASPQAAGESSYEQKKRIRYEEVLKLLDTTLHLSPSMVIALYNKAVVMHKMGRRSEALSLYTAVIDAPNAPAEAFFNRGLIYLSLGDRQNGRKDLSKAGELGIYQAYNILKRIK